MYAQVVMDIAHTNVDRRFTYLVPEGLSLRPGHRVMAPFGPRNRPVEAFVLSLSEDPPGEGYGLKPILRTLEPWPALLPEQLTLAEWIAESYNCRMIDALRLMLPAAMRGGRVKEKTVRTLRLAAGMEEETARQSLLDGAGKPRAPRQLEVLDFILQAGTDVAMADLAGFFPGAAAAVHALLKKGILEEAGHVTFRRPRRESGLSPDTAPKTLTEGQRAAVETVEGAMAAGGGTLLLHGVTGSGKTEVYLRCIERVLQAGKTAIVLVPEIALTPQTVRRFSARFGEGVAVLHSRLSDGERFDEWRRIRMGRVQVVVGARSAVFAPIENLGLIVVDEEHEQTYQSEITPRYHAIEVAKKRCRMAGVPLLLGSATPSVQSYVRAVSGSYRLIELPERVGNRPLPEVTIVDMREEFAKGNGSIFSETLYDRLNTCIRKGQQAILFINRRGYSTFVSCRGCGYVFQCPECDISTTYHRMDESLRCHFCGHRESLPDRCPVCGKPYIKYFGVGTQQVEEQLQRFFPGVTAIRMDMDTTRGKDSHQTLLARFGAGEAQVLIGTQMIAKGLDFPNVTLVGVVAADATLHIPDYRSAERTFQLITQVAGRAGRDEAPGSVVIQTYTPEHPSIVFAKEHDYKGFFAHEIAMRRAGGFPPFTLFIRALFSGPDAAALAEAGERFGKGLEAAVQTALGEHGGELLDCRSSPAPIRKKRGAYRYQVLLRLKRSSHTPEAIRAIYEYAAVHRGELFATLEVNASDLL